MAERTERYETVFISIATGNSSFALTPKLYGDATMVLKKNGSYCSLPGVWTAFGGVAAGSARS